jgi:hypothetical protein
MEIGVIPHTVEQTGYKFRHRYCENVFVSICIKLRWIASMLYLVLSICWLYPSCLNCEIWWQKIGYIRKC